MKIPGSAPAGGDDAVSVDTTLSKTNRPVRRITKRAERPPWYAQPRWHEFGGARPPMTPMRASLIAKKRAAAKNPVPLERCIAGNDIVAGWQSGRLAPYQLERAKNPIAPPREDLQLRLCGAKWKLRGTRMRLLEFIALAMIPLKGVGLVATHAELGVLCEVRERWVGALLRDLRTWGLVKADPTFVAYGHATSQRANCYRLTTLAAVVFGLPWFGAGVLPDPEPQRTRPAPGSPAGTGGGGIARAQAQHNCTGHPESTLGEITYSGENAFSGAVLAVSTSSTPDFIRAAPADSADDSCPEISRETCEVSQQPALQAGVAESSLVASVAGERELDAAPNLEEAIDRVRRDYVDERPRPDPEAPRDSRRWRREREARDRELVEERELERIGGDVQDLAGAAAADKPAPVSTNGRVTLDDVDADLRKVLEQANASFERRRLERMAGFRRARRPTGGDS